MCTAILLTTEYYYCQDYRCVKLDIPYGLIRTSAAFSHPTKNVNSRIRNNGIALKSPPMLSYPRIDLPLETSSDCLPNNEAAKYE